MEQSFESRATIDDDFCGNSVLVIMNHQVGRLNKVHEFSYFSGIDIVSITDLIEISGDLRNARLNKKNFTKFFYLIYQLMIKKMF